MNLIIIVLIFIAIYIFVFKNTLIESFQTISQDPIDCLCRNSENFLSLHTSVCAGKVTSCTQTAFLNSNKEMCRDLGFEPCKNLEYSKNNKIECSKLGYNPCTFSDYLIANGTECRTAGFEPCKNNSYLLANADICLANNFDACKISADYLKNNYVKCKARGTDACTDPRLPDFAKNNPTLCPITK
jgi:hypothetical protein